MKLDRTEKVVIAIFVLGIVTANAYMRVKAAGRHTQEAFEKARAAAQADAGVQTPDADTAHE